MSRQGPHRRRPLSQLRRQRNDHPRDRRGVIWRALSGSLLDNLAEICRQARVVAGEPLVKGLLRLVRGFARLRFALASPALVFLHLGLKFSHDHGHYSPPHYTGFNAMPAKVEKMTGLGRFRSAAVSKPWRMAIALAPALAAGTMTATWPPA